MLTKYNFYGQSLWVDHKYGCFCRKLLEKQCTEGYHAIGSLIGLGVYMSFSQDNKLNYVSRGYETFMDSFCSYKFKKTLREVLLCSNAFKTYYEVGKKFTDGHYYPERISEFTVFFADFMRTLCSVAVDTNIVDEFRKSIHFTSFIEHDLLDDMKAVYKRNYQFKMQWEYVEDYDYFNRQRSGYYRGTHTNLDPNDYEECIFEPPRVIYDVIHETSYDVIIKELTPLLTDKSCSLLCSPVRDFDFEECDESNIDDVMYFDLEFDQDEYNQYEKLFDAVQDEVVEHERDVDEIVEVLRQAIISVSEPVFKYAMRFVWIHEWMPESVVDLLQREDVRGIVLEALGTCKTISSIALSSFAVRYCLNMIFVSLSNISYFIFLLNLFARLMQSEHNQICVISYLRSYDGPMFDWSRFLFDCVFGVYPYSGDTIDCIPFYYDSAGFWEYLVVLRYVIIIKMGMRVDFMILIMICENALRNLIINMPLAFVLRNIEVR